MVITFWAGFSIIRRRAIAAVACLDRFHAALPRFMRGFHAKDPAMGASKLAHRAVKRPALARRIAIVISIPENSEMESADFTDFAARIWLSFLRNL
jgi:hypothetical protein